VGVGKAAAGDASHDGQVETRRGGDFVVASMAVPAVVPRAAQAVPAKGLVGGTLDQPRQWSSLPVATFDNRKPR
jgi:hypothetical protein